MVFSEGFTKISPGFHGLNQDFTWVLLGLGFTEGFHQGFTGVSPGFH